LVIADLHLDLSDRDQGQAFADWLGRLRDVPRLIVLGDLFEAWYGPAQQALPSGAVVLDTLRAKASQGTALEFVPGNRDFLVGRWFELRTGMRIHERGAIGLLGRTRCLLIHGDELCTKDLGYQCLRRVVRSAPVRFIVPRLPRRLGSRLARGARRASVNAVTRKAPERKAQQADACLEFASRHRAEVVVCGHAHAFRDERLPEGPRWLVLDAFGGERDMLTADSSCNLQVRSSRSIGRPSA
jgi:UDP-2,3-diacylglucosamine hydrolase